MKKLALVVMIMGLFYVSMAQEISDEQLYKYALLNTVVEEMKSEISSVVNDMIKNQEGIDGKRYLELAKAKGDEAKYAELEAQDFEKQFIELVDSEKAKRIDDIKTVNQILATKMLGEGGKVYKQIKSELKGNDDLKARYESIKASLEMSSDS